MRVASLELFRQELEFNKYALAERQSEEDGAKKRVVVLPPLKNELWKALSDGGELQWIRDLDLLNVIATAYHNIMMTIFLEEKFFEATHYSGIQVQQQKYPKDFIMEYLVNSDLDVTKAIDAALSAINQNLN